MGRYCLTVSAGERSPVARVRLRLTVKRPSNSEFLNGPRRLTVEGNAVGGKESGGTDCQSVLLATRDPRSADEATDVVGVDGLNDAFFGNES
jgi:hypothetical protein